MEVGSLHYDLNIDDKNLKGQLDSSDKAVKNFGEHVSSVGEKMQAGFREASKVLAVVGAGLTVFAKSATDFTVDLVKQSKSLGREIGVTTTEASRLVAAFGRMGVGADAAQQMFGIFSKKIQASTDATDANRLAAESLKIEIEKTQQSIAKVTAEIAKNGDKTGELHLKLRELNNTLEAQQISLDQSADAFMKLGISTTDASGKQKDFNTILFEVADRFKAMPDGVTKTALALELFGRSGKDMIKVLNLGSSGIQELEKEADKLGLTLNEKTIVSISNLIKSQKDLKQQTDALKIAVGTATAPPLTAFNEALNHTLAAAMSAHEPLKTLTVDILAFGGPVSVALSGLAAFAGNISSIGERMGKLLIGFGVIGLVLLALGVIVFEVVKHWDSLRGSMEAIGNTIYGIVKPAWDILKAALDFVSSSLSAVGAAVMQNVGPALAQLWVAITRLWNAINPAFLDALKILGAILAVMVVVSLWVFINVLNVVIQVLSMVISAISNVIGWLSNFIGWIGNAVGAVARATGAMIGLFFSLAANVGMAVGRIPGIVAGAVGAAVGAVWGWAGAFFGAGWGLINALANGIESAFGRAIGAVRNGLSAVRRLLPFSDAKEGPLKDLTLSGRRFSETFAKGITRGAGAIQDAVGSSLVSPFGSIGANIIAPGMNLAPAAVAGGTTTRYGDTVVNIGEIHNQQDENLVLRRLDRNSQLEAMGISPVAGG